MQTVASFWRLPGMTATKSSILLPSTFTRSTQNVIMKKVLFISIIVLLGTGLFSGCKNDKDQTYLYAIGIDGYAYDGSTLLGPMLYLESLGIAKSLSLFRQTNRMPISRPLSGSARKWARSMRLRSRRTATRFMSVMSCRLWVRNKRRFRRKNSGKNRDVFYCGSSARKIKMLFDFPCRTPVIILYYKR